MYLPPISETTEEIPLNTLETMQVTCDCPMTSRPIPCNYLHFVVHEWHTQLVLALVFKSSKMKLLPDNAVQKCHI